jgi:TRIAP1/MDM35 family protein
VHLFFLIFFCRWYSEKFVKGQWDKEECVAEWKKYRDCLSENLDGKLLTRILEVDGELNPTKQATDSKESSS